MNFIKLTNEEGSVKPAQCADLPEPSLLADTLTKWERTRAATFTRVNGTVSCFCNKRLQN